MAGGGGGWFEVKWYATLFRGDQFEAELMKIAPVALRYGATEWEVFRSLADKYSFSQYAAFERDIDWEGYWYGEEFVRFRRSYSGWYQVPVVPIPSIRVGRGALAPVEAEA